MNTKASANASPTGGSLVIVIPTFRRLALLAKLLDTLAPELAGRDGTVIVGDNDCDAAVHRVLSQRTDIATLHYLPVPQRGVAQVRNALVTAATVMVPDWQWLLMLDDDGQVTPGWLDAMVSAGATFDADLVGGPVEGVLPETAGPLARNSIFARRRRWPTGPVTLLNTTQNLALRRRLINLVGLPLFDNRYGASGGEDYDLFRRAGRAGARLVWCDEAIVVEPAPAERLTNRALLHRYYSTGIYMAPIDRHYDGFGSTVFAACKGLLRGIAEAALGTIARKPDLAARGTLTTAHYLGRFSGFLGASSARYVAPEQPGNAQ